MTTTREQLTRIDSDMPISIHVNEAADLLERFLPHVARIAQALSDSENWQTVIESKLLEMEDIPANSDRIRMQTALPLPLFIGRSGGVEFSLLIRGR